MVLLFYYQGNSLIVKDAPRDAHSRDWKMSQATALGARVRKADSLFFRSEGMTLKTKNEIGWKKHPRPQLRRGLFHMLEKGWRLNGQDICVPFPPQAPLSGYEGDVGTRLCYEVSFVLPESFTTLPYPLGNFICTIPFA